MLFPQRIFRAPALSFSFFSFLGFAAVQFREYDLTRGTHQLRAMGCHDLVHHDDQEMVHSEDQRAKDDAAGKQATKRTPPKVQHVHNEKLNPTSVVQSFDQTPVRKASARGKDSARPGLRGVAKPRQMALCECLLTYLPVTDLAALVAGYAREDVVFLSLDGFLWLLDVYDFRFRLMGLADGMTELLHVAQPTPNGVLLQNRRGPHAPLLVTRSSVEPLRRSHPRFRALRFWHAGQEDFLGTNKSRALVFKSVFKSAPESKHKRCRADDLIDELFFCLGRVFVLQINGKMFSVSPDASAEKRDEPPCPVANIALARKCWSESKFYVMSLDGRPGAVFDVETRTWSRLPPTKCDWDHAECLAVSGDRLFLKRALADTVEECVDGAWVERPVSHRPQCTFILGFGV